MMESDFDDHLMDEFDCPECLYDTEPCMCGGVIHNAAIGIGEYLEQCDACFTKRVV